MELKTKSKRSSMDCSIDVFYEQTEGFSKHLNDKENYKMVLVSSGSFVVEEDGEYKMISAPAGIVLNEKADFRLVSESNVKCDIPEADERHVLMLHDFVPIFLT